MERSAITDLPFAARLRRRVCRAAWWVALLSLAAVAPIAEAQTRDRDRRGVPPFGWENQYPDPYERRMPPEVGAVQETVELFHAGQMEQHLAMISDRVRQNWLRPEGSADIDCDVRITQTRAGEIFSLAVVCCEGSDAVVRSIEAAVEQAAPLPIQKDPALFQRVLRFRFMPDRDPEDIEVNLFESSCSDT